MKKADKKIISKLKKSTMASNQAKNYPLPKFHFIVEWGGNRLGFSEISGLKFETEVIEYREGSSPVYHSTKQPGRTKYCNIILKRGVFLGDFQFYQFWKQTFSFMESGQNHRRDITIKLLNDEHQPILTWKLSKAWPCKMEYGDLRADSNEVLIETLELVHEGLSVVDSK